MRAIILYCDFYASQSGLFVQQKWPKIIEISRRIAEKSHQNRHFSKYGAWNTSYREHRIICWSDRMMIRSSWLRCPFCFSTQEFEKAASSTSA